MKIKQLKKIFFLIIVLYGSFIQAQTVEGKVTSSGLPLPGASIIVKGTANGTSADFDGDYQLQNVSSEAVLVVSYLGYITKEVSVEGQSKIDITLEEDAAALEEVVIVAYGTSSKKDLTGAVAVIGTEELNSFPATTVDQALQGKTAGVQVTSNSGAPGASVSVNIRGVGSFGSTTPLYIVDGFPTNDISFINPNTIQSLSVLKDASATALYGVRASNGVVIIQTKQGVKGKVQVELNSFVSFRSKPQKVDVLEVNQFSAFATELSSSTDANVSGTAMPYDGWSNPSGLRNIDWQDEIFSSASTKSTTLSVRGGGEKSRVSFNAGIFDEEGTLLESKYKRYDFGLNAAYDISDKLRLKGNVKYITSQNFQPLGTGRDGLLNLFSTIPHLAPAGEVNLNGGTNPTNLPVDANGNFGAFPDVNGIGEAFRDGRNWVARALENDQDNVSTTILANIDAEWDIYRGISTQLKVGVRSDNFSGEFFQPAYYRSLGNIDERSDALYSTNQSTNNEWLAEYLLKYKKTFSEKHTVNVLGGVSAQRRFGKFTGATGRGFLNNDIRNVGSADAIQNAFGFSDRRTLASTFARLNYNFDKKYYITGTIRRDGVGNVFGLENLWGVFPSFAAGWNIDEESFMDDSIFNALKFRASWGETGNFEGIDAFQYLSLYSSGPSANNDTNYSFDGTTGSTLGLATLFSANPDVTWETQTQTNIGLEGELLDGKVYFTIDYFNRKSEDFLFDQIIPTQSGFPIRPENGGTVVNKGFEFLVGYKKNDGDFTYEINANISLIDNEITDLNNKSGEVRFNNEFLDSFNESGFWYDLTRSQVGGEVGSFYGFVADGIFQNQAEVDAAPTQSVNTSPGDRRFKDLNGDGVINGEDRTTIGSPVPDFFGSLNLNLSYRNFDLGLNFYGSYGSEVLNLVKRELESASAYGNAGSFSNVSTEYYNNRWNGEGSTNIYARALIDDNDIQNNRASSYFVEDGSYFRLRSLNLGYNIPSNITKKIGLTNLKIYATAQNVFTITKYTGVDPEIGQNADRNGKSSVTTRGIDAGAYPLSKTFSLGLNLKF